MKTKMMVSKELFWTVIPLTGLLGVLLTSRLQFHIPIANASTPQAIEQHQREVSNRCLKNSGLQNAQSVGNLITFGDEVGYDALMVQGHYPQPHMNNQVGRSLCLFNRRTRKVYISEAGQTNHYTSNQFGFQFDYPLNFVAKPQNNSKKGHEGSINLWTQQDYDGIQANTIPTELPPHISIEVRQNSRQLTLREWVMQDNQFISPQRFAMLTVGGQRAIAFQSTGLYEYENIVLSLPDRSYIIVLRLETMGMPKSDTVYRTAFERIISSFEPSAQVQ